MNKKKLGIVVITKKKFIRLITDGDLRVLNSPSKDRDLNKLIRNYPRN